ncbi:MAG: BON domain-containing protein [FCB group bacterium]|jgi:osmotically-inducible protein OsmY|nr:BON domain-containing protein [FCB group bacterium]
MLFMMHKLVPAVRRCGWVACLAVAGYAGLAAAQDASPIAPGESRLNLPDAVDAPPPTATPAVQPSVNDVATGTALRALLASDNAIPAENINVSVAGGVATLRGSVPSLFVRDRAIELAQSMRGIERVDNLLAVAGPARGDEAILGDVTAALAREPAIAAMNIGVGVQDGTVTLSGTVDRWQTQQHVSELVKGIPGVQAINSRISFTTTNQPDDQILAEVQRRFMEDDAINPGTVRVSVQDGAVRLSGTVGSVFERNRAITDAWVEGVNVVSADALRVDVAARGEMIRPAESQMPTDQEIRGALSNALAYSDTLISFNPEIRVANGVVTLDGVVNSEEARREAETIAAAVPGVQSVQNLLEVRGVNGAGTAPGTTTATVMNPGDTSVSTEDRVDTGAMTAEMPDDGTLPPLVAQFRDLVNEDPELQSYQLSSTVSDDGFRLYGIVDSKAKKDRAERLAASLPGVDKVISKIRVSENWQVTNQGLRPSDAEILQAIQQALAWNPYIDLSALTIRVNKGVVTLDGSVENWRDSSMASRAAILSGAVDVRNNLSVGTTASEEARQIAIEEAQAGEAAPMRQNQTVAVVPGTAAGARAGAEAQGLNAPAGGVPMTYTDDGFGNVDVVAVPGGGGVLVPGVVGGGVEPGTGLNRDISQVAPRNVPVDDGTTTTNPTAEAPGASGVPGAGGTDPDVAAVPGSAGLTAPGADQVTDRTRPAGTPAPAPAPGQTNPVPAPTTPAPAPSTNSGGGGTSGGAGSGGASGGGGSSGGGGGNG